MAGNVLPDPLKAQAESLCNDCCRDRKQHYGAVSRRILEFLLCYMTRPEHQLKVREEIYLSNAPDLF